MVDRASVDRSLYHSDERIKSSTAAVQEIASGSEKCSTRKQENYEDVDKDVLSERKRMFEFTSREELGRFPILLRGL